MPTNRLLVGMFSQNSPEEGIADDVQSRIAQLRQGIQAAFDLALTWPPPPPPRMPGAPPPPPPLPLPGKTLRIFLAPEYFFRKNINRCRQARASTAYSEQEMNIIRSNLQSLSRSYHNFLLIGGSVFWAESISFTVFIRHSVFVFHSGHLLKEYEKKNDCGELKDFETVPNQWHLFKPGRVDGMFTCSDLNCGIETCLDHDKAQLRQDGASDLDLQFVVSNTVTIRPSSVRTNGLGYVLHCNAGNFGCKIYQNPFDPSGEVGRGTPGVGYASANNIRLALFSLPWPARPRRVPSPNMLRIATH